jgi:C-1 hydroxylase
MAASNKLIVRKIQDAWNQGKLDELDQYFAPEFDDRQSALAGIPPGLAGAKLAYQGGIKSFPDRHAEIVDMVAEGDKVYVRVKVTGSNLGGAAWLGAPEPDGKAFEIESWSLYRFADGKVVEHAGPNDAYGLAMQLGGIKPPARA